MWLKKEDLGGLLLVVGIIAVVAGFFFLAPTASPVTYQPVEETGSALEILPMENLTDVHVNATVIAPGFITFHTAMGLAPGPLLGHSAYLSPGQYEDVLVTLSPLEANLSYFALMIKDDGDHIYEPGIDLPVMSDGEVIKRAFVTPAL